MFGEVVTPPSAAVLDLILGFRLLTMEESSGSEVLKVLMYIFRRLELCGWFTVLLPLVAVYTHCSVTQVPLEHSNSTNYLTVKLLAETRTPKYLRTLQNQNVI